MILLSLRKARSVGFAFFIFQKEQEIKNLLKQLPKSDVEIHIMKRGHEYWDGTAKFALDCSWKAGGYLANSWL